MDSLDYGTPEPNVKFEHSPTESFMSTPGGEYPSLFGNSPLPSTMNPRDMMTPESTHGDDCHNDNASQSAGNRDATSSTPEPGAGEKKPTKKRKSWGQVLPEPKTNLPPRYVRQSPSQYRSNGTNPPKGNAPRQKTRRSSAESSVSSATGEQHSRPVSASARRSRLLRRRTKN